MALGSLGDGAFQPRVLARSARLAFQRFRTAEASAAAPKGGIGSFVMFPHLNASGSASRRTGNLQRVFSTARAFGRNPYLGRYAQAKLARRLRTRAGLAHRLAGLRR